MRVDAPPAAAAAAASTLPSFAAEALSSLDLSDPTMLPDDEKDRVVFTAAAGALLLFLLPLFDGAGPFADFGLSSVIGGGALGYAALRKDDAGAYARKLGGAVAVVVDKLKAWDAENGLSEKVTSKLPGGGGKGLSYADIKAFGISGTVAYILTELAFWAVAFPVASFTLYNTAGHWPDLSDGADRTAVLGFIFAGANVARLAVPLRFGVAFAAAPWCEENLVKPAQAKLAELKGGE